MKKIALAFLGLAVSAFTMAESGILAYTCTAVRTTIGVEERGEWKQFRSTDMPVWDIVWYAKAKMMRPEQRTDFYPVHTMIPVVYSLAAPIVNASSYYGSFVMDKASLSFMVTDISALNNKYYPAAVMASGTCEVINAIR